MTQAEFSALSNQVIAALDADPFGTEFATLDQRYTEALDEMRHAVSPTGFEDARLARLEAAYDARQDYKHLAYSNF